MAEDFIEITVGSDPTHSVIWLHGLGADGHDFEGIIPQLNLSKDAAIRFTFPHAPVQPVTINGGMEMRAWYDIISMDFSDREDLAGLTQSQKRVERIIENENARGIASANIFLAGFSQGGAVVLHTGLRYKESLAGILALSTYLPRPATLENERHSHNNTTPIFMAHGQFDQVIPLSFAKQSADVLKQLDYPIDWHSFAMEHSVSLEEIELISAFINAQL